MKLVGPQTLLILLAAVLICSAARAKDLTAGQVADQIQKFYDSTKDFQAAFQQEYFSKALGRKKSSSGFIYIKKPGKMRWDYKQPRAKHFVADGQALYIYDPDLEQVMVDRKFSGSQLTTAVTFLWGRGNLKDEFKVEFSKRTDLGGPEHYVLELLPKKNARFKRLTFVVAKKNFQVVETLVVDPGDNINHIFFAKASINVGLKDQSFVFKIPAGVEVIEMPKKP
jgi:outer membrane lipoprotein carrier protein